ncbi:hypothetical protein AWZ03_015452, partial [Drosophila navojoa]
TVQLSPGYGEIWVHAASHNKGYLSNNPAGYCRNPALAYNVQSRLLQLSPDYVEITGCSRNQTVPSRQAAVRHESPRQGRQ